MSTLAITLFVASVISVGIQTAFIHRWTKEIYLYRYSLVLNKRRTFPYALYSIGTGYAFILINFMLLAIELFVEKPPLPLRLTLSMIHATTLCVYGYSIGYRIWMTWEVLAQTEKYFKEGWTIFLEVDEVETQSDLRDHHPKMDLATDTWLANLAHRRVQKYILYAILLTVWFAIFATLSAAFASSHIVPFIFAWIFFPLYIIFLVAPWIAIIYLHTRIPSIEDTSLQMKREMRRVLNTTYLGLCFSFLANVLFSGESHAILGETIVFQIIALTLFATIFFQSKWVFFELSEFIQYDKDSMGRQRLDKALRERMEREDEEDEKFDMGSNILNRVKGYGGIASPWLEKARKSHSKIMAGGFGRRGDSQTARSSTRSIDQSLEISHTAESKMSPSSSKKRKNYRLRHLLRTEWGFDLFARHLNDECACETLMAFYEFEAYQWMIIDKLREQEFVNVAGLHLVGFPVTLPKSAIIEKSVPVYIRMSNRKRVATLTNPLKSYQEIDPRSYDDPLTKKRDGKEKGKGNGVKNALGLAINHSKGGAGASNQAIISRTGTNLDQVRSVSPDTALSASDLKRDDDDENESDDSSDSSSLERGMREMEREEQERDDERLANDRNVLIFKSKGHDLWKKYIREGSRLEINVSHDERAKYRDWMKDRQKWIENREWSTMNKLLTLFNEPKREVFKLMRQSFKRFRDKADYGKWKVKADAVGL